MSGRVRRRVFVGLIACGSGGLLAVLLAVASGALLDDEVVRGTPVAETRLEAEGTRVVRDLRIERIAVRTIREGRLYGTQDHYLFVSDDFGETFERRGVIPKLDPGIVDRLRDLVGRHPIVRRARGVKGPSNIVVLGSGTILMFYDRIYRSTDGGWSFTPLSTPVDGFHGPAPFRSVAVDPQDRVFYGEYAAGQRPQTVRLIRGTDDGTRWEVCRTFAPGEVFHVHSVSHDAWRGRLWVATGDLDEESGVWELDPECRGVELLGGGAQRWRTISPLFTAEFVLWGSDDDQTGSDIWRKWRGSKELEHLHRIGKPSYAAALLPGGIFVVSTTYEPGSKFTRENDPDRSSELWVSNSGEDWALLDRFAWVEEDHWWGRARARALVPASDGSSPYLFVVPDATEDGFVTYRYRFDNGPGQ